MIRATIVLVLASLGCGDDGGDTHPTGVDPIAEMPGTWTGKATSRRLPRQRGWYSRSIMV